MWKTIIVSIQQALANFKSNLFHTLLSVLGIVIGVAALVGILSMIDGMEQYAHTQISETTDFQVLSVFPKAYKEVNGIRVAKDSFPNFTYEHYQLLREKFDEEVLMLFAVGSNQSIKQDTLETAARVQYTTIPYREKEAEMMYGRELEPTDEQTQQKVVVINELLAVDLLGEGDLAKGIAQTITIKETEYEIVGITKLKDDRERPMAWIPISTIGEKYWHQSKSPHPLALKAPTVEALEAIEQQMKGELTRLFPGEEEEFKFISDEFRVEQITQGFLIFRLVMGFIVGISVLVGGIGVMNVLLISVTERTKEIGLRKAMGAKKRDIIVQFLAESTTISFLGCALGLILGVLATLVFVPILRMLTEAPFQASFTLNTMLIITVVAFFIGILFGTYPAMRASKLDPVDAIRRE